MNQIEATQQPELSGSDHILSEILGVLNRIDGHLQVQKIRIDELESKINTASTSIKETVSTTKSPEDSFDRRLKVAMPLQPLKERRISTFSTSPSTRFRGPGPEIPGRNNSGLSPSTCSSIYRFGDDKLHQRAIAERFNDRHTPRNSLPGKHRIPESLTPHSNSVPQLGSASRKGTLSSLLPQTSAQNEYSDHKRSYDGLDWYMKFPSPKSWVTRTGGRGLEIKYGGEHATDFWKTFVGDSCTIPPDGRVEMTFQQHILERLDETQVESLLKTLRDVSTRLGYRHPGDLEKRGSFKVTDYEFDPNFEKSVAEYRADISSGIFLEDRRTKPRATNPINEDVKTAPWKRIM